MSCHIPGIPRTQMSCNSACPQLWQTCRNHWRTLGMRRQTLLQSVRNGWRIRIHTLIYIFFKIGIDWVIYITVYIYIYTLHTYLHIWIYTYTHTLNYIYIYIYFDDYRINNHSENIFTSTCLHVKLDLCSNLLDVDWKLSDLHHTIQFPMLCSKLLVLFTWRLNIWYNLIMSAYVQKQIVFGLNRPLNSYRRVSSDSFTPMMTSWQTFWRASRRSSCSTEQLSCGQPNRK